MRILLILSLIMGSLSASSIAQADTTLKNDAEERWFYLSGTSYSGETPLEACETAVGLTRREVIEVWEINENQSGCQHLNYKGDLGGVSVVTLKCNRTGNPTDWLTGACERADDNFTPCTSAGNPISLAEGTKFQESIDWRSPLDPRFLSSRSYRSDTTMQFSPVSTGFGQGWAGVWNAQLTEQDTSDLVAHRGNAMRYLFTGTGQMTPYRSGHRYSLLDSDPAEGNRPRLSDGSGKLEFYQSTGSSRLLDEVRWSDGYSISFTYNAGNQLVEMSDNRGQVAQFTWDDTLNTSYTVPVITKIEVDTNFDGSAFTADLSLDYTYVTPPLFVDQLALAGVSRTEIATATTNVIWEYEYSSDNLLGSPIKLTSLRDGRLDTLGAPFTYARWTYENAQDFGVTPAISRPYTGVANRSEHFGGDGTVDITYSSNLTSTQTNALGKQTTTEFELVAGRYRPVSVTGVASANCLGTSKTVSYTPGAGEPEGYIYERIERNGSRTTYTRDARGLVLTKTEDADGISPRVTSYTWDTNLRLPLTRTTTQMTESFTYSATGLLLQYSKTDVLSGSPDFGKVRTWTYTYTTLASGLQVLTALDGPGLLADGVSDIITYTYDVDGNLTKVIDPNGLETEFLSFNPAGQPTLVRGPDQIEWGFSYDITGRVLTATFDPSNQAKTTSFAYDVVGQLTSYTNSLGKTWSFEYNEARRLVKTTDPESDIASYTYDLLGNLTRTEYSNGASAFTFEEDISYDELGRIMQTIAGESQTWNYKYDLEDNLDTIIDPLANQITYTFDALNRITGENDQGSNTSSQTYNDSNLVSQFTDPRSIDTGFSYNGFGDLVAEVSADRGTLSYTFNNRGLVSSMTDGNGVLSTYEYDDGGRLTAHRFPTEPAQDQVFTYDLQGGNTNSIGQLSKVVDGSGKFRLRRADNGTIDQDRRFIDGVKYEVEYNFDEEGNLIWIQYPSDRRVYFYYNDADRVKRIRHRIQEIDPNTGNYPPLNDIAINIQYEPFGPLRQFRYGDGLFHGEYYDEAYRLTRITDLEQPIELRDTSYMWTDRNNLASITDALNSSNNESYGYTPREFLNTATGLWDTLDYTYDGVGNRTSMVETVGASVLTQDYSYPLSSNQLSEISESTVPVRSFTYDSAGNVISDNRLGDIYTYTYNAANRLSSVSLNGVLQAEYKYNVLGQQVWRKLSPSGQIIHSLFDLDGNRIAEYDYDAVADTSTLIREYIWLDGRPVAVVEGGVTYYVRVDHIGRPVFATDGTGAKVWEATYLPFGEVLATTGTPMELRFPGQWFQAESGLHQNWMRDYDPTTGRYLQADPLGLADGASVYGYVRQNPGRYVDPTGELIPIIPILAGAAAGLALDYLIDRVAEYCECNDPEESVSFEPRYADIGAAYGMTGPFGQKRRTGIAGGGRSGSRTSAFSQYLSDNYSHKGSINRWGRRIGRGLSRGIPIAGIALAATDLYRLSNCLDREG